MATAKRQLAEIRSNQFVLIARAGMAIPSYEMTSAQIHVKMMKQFHDHVSAFVQSPAIRLLSKDKYYLIELFIFSEEINLKSITNSKSPIISEITIFFLIFQKPLFFFLLFQKPLFFFYYFRNHSFFSIISETIVSRIFQNLQQKKDKKHFYYKKIKFTIILYFHLFYKNCAKKKWKITKYYANYTQIYHKIHFLL